MNQLIDQLENHYKEHTTDYREKKHQEFLDEYFDFRKDTLEEISSMLQESVLMILNSEKEKIYKAKYGRLGKEIREDIMKPTLIIGELNNYEYSVDSRDFNPSMFGQKDTVKILERSDDNTTLKEIVTRPALNKALGQYCLSQERHTFKKADCHNFYNSVLPPSSRKGCFEVDKSSIHSGQYDPIMNFIRMGILNAENGGVTYKHSGIHIGKGNIISKMKNGGLYTQSLEESLQSHKSSRIDIDMPFAEFLYDTEHISISGTERLDAIENYNTILDKLITPSNRYQ